MVTIVATEVESWEKPILKRKLKGHNLIFIDEPLSKDNVAKAKSAQILITFIYSRLDKQTLQRMPKLKGIATMSTGFDHVDIGYCKKKGIVVSNVPYYGENTVAEHTMALILSIARKIPRSVDRTRKGDFTLDGLRGFDLKGKTLGVIGGGHIGLHVVKMARAFEMDVLVSDVQQDKRLANVMGFCYASLEVLLKRSDIITLHAPYNKKTHHLLDDKAFKKVKKGAILINTSRGGLVDTTALLKALDKGTIAFAGLDVLEGECEIKEERQLLSGQFKASCDLKTLLQDHILLSHKNVLVTPHNAFNSKEAIERILTTTLKNVQGMLKKDPLNIVY